MQNTYHLRSERQQIERVNLPPDYFTQPIRANHCWRKKWRYIGFFSEDLMLCTAKAHIGPLMCSWWAVWNRAQRTLYEKTYLWSTKAVCFSPGQTSFQGPLSGKVLVEEDAGVETLHPHGMQGWIWTRKQAIRPAECQLILPNGCAVATEGFAIIDDTLGYHERRTEWFWSAGVGKDAYDRAIGWNLVSGVNDSQTASERTLWVDGFPQEVQPVTFQHDLSTIFFHNGCSINFSPEANRERRDNLLYISSSYEQPFGTFSGNFQDDIQIKEGMGVMEYHKAKW